MPDLSHFHHHIANPRSLAVPGHAPRTWIPTTGIFTNTRARSSFLRGIVTEVHESSVTLSTGAFVAFDYLVMATGAKHGVPSRPMAMSKAEGVKEFEGYAKAVERAARILIVGGGPVGVETAGEIRARYPEKEITVVHDRPGLIPGPYGDAFRENVKAALERHRVKVILNESIDLPAMGAPFVEETRTLVTNRGTKIESDLQMAFIGYGSYNSEPILMLDPELLDEMGQIKVLPTLQVQNFQYPHIFSLGDVAATNAPKLALHARTQAACVSTNLQRLIWARMYYPPTASTDFQAEGRGEVVSLTPYSMAYGEDLIVVGVGPDDAVVSTGVVSLGGWAIKRLTGKDLGLSQAWADLGATMPPEWTSA
ncbi:Apoptosis-inducing factor 2 [Irineochytrium annulatum]|nr:Apoptosis-inducing factor 2 [Irineochytrium annulatum]